MVELTKAQKLLVAAGRLAQTGNADFTAEDLVVAAHKAFPADFSMKGYPEHPDSNAVYTQFMGKSAALIVRGWLQKVGPKRYRLTPKGLDDLNGLEGQESISTARLERHRDEDVGGLLTATSFDLAREGRADEITFHQYCRFIGLGASDKWQAVKGKLTNAYYHADELTRLGVAGQPLRIFYKNKSMRFDPDDLRLVRPLLDQLAARFKPEMDEWERVSGPTRTGES